MSTKLVVRGSPYVTWVYDSVQTASIGTSVNALVQYDLPAGSTEGATSDTLRTQWGSPDGTVWMGVLTTGSLAQLVQVDVHDGRELARITLATATDIVSGYTLVRRLNGNFVVVVIIAAANAVVEYSPAGAIVATYGISATVIGTIALAVDDTTLAYAVSGDTVLHRWDLNSNAAGTDYFDMGSTWTKHAQLVPNGDVLGVYSDNLVNAKRFTSSGAVAALYAPGSDVFAQAQGRGVAYDPSTNLVYTSTAAAALVAGTLACYPYVGNAFAGDPTWSIHVPFYQTNVVTRLVLTPSFGDAASYTVATTTEPIRRMRQAPHLSRLGLRTFYHRFQLDFAAGGALSDGTTEAKLCLQWSDDAGVWSDEQWVDASAAGERQFRALWYRLGQSRDRVFRVSQTSAVPIAWLSAWLDLTAGEN